MKRREMQGYVRAELTQNELAQSSDLFVGIVVSGDEQGRDLEPYVGLVLEVAQGVEDRLETRGTQGAIELRVETLEIHVGRVHGPKEISPRLAVDVAGGDGHRSQAHGAAGPGGIDRQLGKNDRIVVGKCHAPASPRARGLCDGFGIAGRGQAIRVPRFGDVPILAELAAEVAARRAEAEHPAAREEVIEGLFLDRIDAKPRGAPVAGQHDVIAESLPHEAEAPLFVLEAAAPRTQGAFDSAVVQLTMPAPSDSSVGQRAMRRCAHAIKRSAANVSQKPRS